MTGQQKRQDLVPKLLRVELAPLLEQIQKLSPGTP